MGAWFKSPQLSTRESSLHWKMATPPRQQSLSAGTGSKPRRISSRGSIGPDMLLMTLWIACTIVASHAHRPNERDPNELVGLWGSELTFGPEARGELTIVRRDSNWRASISGIEVSASISSDRLTFNLPGGRGEFRGKVQGEKLLGLWIQPKTPHV